VFGGDFSDFGNKMTAMNISKISFSHVFLP
jgi:hypothetical protein